MQWPQKCFITTEMSARPAVRVLRRNASNLALQFLVFPTWMRNGGRNDSGNEPMRFSRSTLGSSDRRMCVLRAAIAARLSRASRKS